MQSRKARKIDGVGYIISPSMIRSLANLPALIGIWTYGDIVRPENHEKAVPVDLWLEAHQGLKKVKPRGRGIRHEPLEWDGLLWCCNDDEPKRISGHASKNSYRCQSDYVKGRGPVCLDIAAHLLDKPLTEAVLQKLDFSPFAEQVLMRLEADATCCNIEYEQRKKESTSLLKRLENLKSYLGDADKKKEDFYWEEIEKTQHRLDELNSCPAPIHRVQAADYEEVRIFLAGINKNWGTYSRTFRNRILNIIIDRVDIRHKGQNLTATIEWKTGQSQVVNIQRPRSTGNRESHWTREELDILEKVWSNAPQNAILAELPGRTWKAISHQAYKQRWHRDHGSSNHTPRRSWESDENDRVRQLYEVGIPISEIVSRTHRSYTAIQQRAWEKGWKRPDDSGDLQKIKQNPEVSKRITSGIVFGGQVNFFTLAFLTTLRAS